MPGFGNDFGAAFGSAATTEPEPAPVTIDLDVIPTGAQGAAVDGIAPGVALVKAAGSTATATVDRTAPIQGVADFKYEGNTFGGVEYSWPAATGNGMSWLFRVPPRPAEGFQFVAAWYDAGNRVGDLEVTPTGALRLRDFNSERALSVDDFVREGQHVRVEQVCTPGSGTGQQLDFYVGANLYGATPDWSTPAFSATQNARTQLTRMVIGQAPSGVNAVIVNIGRFRHANTADKPGPGYTGLPAARAVTATPSAGQVKLDWTAVSGQTGAKVYRSTEQYKGFVALEQQPSAAGASTFTDTTPVNGTRYFYDVRVTNGVGTSPKGSTVSATPTAATTQRVYPSRDVTAANAQAVNPASTTLVSAIAEATQDNSSYVAVREDGRFAFEIDNPNLPLADGTEVRIFYGIPEGARLAGRIALYDGATLLAQDDLKTAAGGFVLVLSSAQYAALLATYAAGRKVQGVFTGEPMPLSAVAAAT